MTALTRLRLTNFRSHANLDLKLDSRPVCLWGANGAGKTNVLEAISQLGPGRGLRAASLPDMTRHDADTGWTVSATLDDDQKIGVGLDSSGHGHKRSIRLDGAPATASDLADLIRIVWLTPAMDSVFRGGASERRRFFDRQVMAHIPSHGSVASRYEKAMRERNALLERGRVDPAWADAIEGRMAEAGALMASNRARILMTLQAAINARPDGFFPKGDLSLDGTAEQAAIDGASLFDIQDQIAEDLAKGRYRDQAAGRTLSGPHRSDLIVIHRPTGAPAGEASTGQQKALLIGLILASARALSEDGDGPSPLILLDEAAAHLDRDRRSALFDELIEIGGQAWLTGTEEFLFEAFGDRAQRVEIKADADAATA
ncbi:MAG: DNA replication/repair protein RecF [Hyphomonadaceae bacterium]|nr:DNA replication/repair protein RecF [Hyphomonadaceae bacterium]